MDYIAHGTVSDEYTATIENEVVNFREDDGKEKLFMTYQQTIMEERMFAKEEGRREGRREGEAKGMLEQIRKTVLRMFKRNTPLEDIADMNDISVEQVKEICKAGNTST